MADSAETLRLVAEVVDKFSGPLKDLQKAMREAKSASTDAHGGASKEVKAHAKAYHELKESIGKTKDTISGVLSPAMAALGITGFTAGAAIAKLVESLKDAATNYHHLNDAARRLGGSVDDVLEIANAYETLGVSQERAVQSAADFGFHMDRLRRGNSEELEGWGKLDGAYQALGQQLKNTKDNMQALIVVRDFMAKNPNIPVDQKTLIGGFLGMPAEIMSKTGDELGAAFNKAIKWRMEHPDNPDITKGLAGAFDDLDKSLKGLDADMVATFGGPAIKMLEGFVAMIDSISSKLKIMFGNKDAPEKLNNGVYDKSAWGRFTSGQMLDDLINGKKGDQAASFDDRFGAVGGSPIANDQKAAQKQSVYEGTLNALRDWWESTKDTAGKALALAGGDVGGSGGGGGGGGGGGPGGGPGGTVPRSMGGDDAPAGGGGPTGVDPGAAGGGINRDKWLKQLQANPRLKEELYRRSLGENSNPLANQAVMEEAANRADIRGNKSFADNSNLSYFQGYYRGAITPKMRKMLDSNFDKVFSQGSDISKGAIDNSSQWLSAKHERNGRFRTTANFGGDGITGHRGVESFEIPGWGESGRGERSRYAAFRTHQLEEASQRRDLLAASRAAGANPPQKVEGDAHLKIGLTGFPKGTTTDLTYGGLFTRYTLSKGQQMEAAEQK